MTKYTVFIGRFQPFHNGHMTVVEKALQVSDKLIMVLGSHESARTPRNPLTTKERIDLIKAALPLEYHNRVLFAPVHDHVYNLQKWIGSVQGAVFGAIHQTFHADGYEISLIGHKKDHTSFYLNLFPTWHSIDVQQTSVLDATNFRQIIYKQMLDNPNRTYLDGLDRYSVGYRQSTELNKLLPVFKNMATQWQKNIDYKLTWGEGPFITVDACVIQSGFVLLISRKDTGLWALPGGFINKYERLEDAVIRELKEETKLKVPVPVLNGSITKTKMYDDPHRSERGRIITQASLFELRNGELPLVKGSDDAKEARWFPINQFLKMRGLMFEDHYPIITDLLGIG